MIGQPERLRTNNSLRVHIKKPSQHPFIEFASCIKCIGFGGTLCGLRQSKQNILS